MSYGHYTKDAALLFCSVGGRGGANIEPLYDVAFDLCFTMYPMMPLAQCGLTLRVRNCSSELDA